MLERVCRAWVAMPGKALAMHGRMKNVIPPRPKAGSQPSLTANNRTNISAIQKLGMDMPNIAPNIDRRSVQPFRLTAAMIPRGVPTNICRKIQIPVMAKVRGKRCSSSLVTGTCERDSPKSK
jgi:hypothetical protein